MLFQNPGVHISWVVKLHSYKALAIRLLYLCCEYDVHTVYSIKELQWFEYFKVVFLKILNMQLCQGFANQVTF